MKNQKTMDTLTKEQYGWITVPDWKMKLATSPDEHSDRKCAKADTVLPFKWVLITVSKTMSFSYQ